MISMRRHLEAVLRAERERTNILFTVALSVGVFVYYELGRRQRVGEAREESRRTWVDSEIGRLNDGQLGQRERAAGVLNLGRVLVGVGTIAAGVAAVIALYATHAI
jgi:hypothetical protein